MAAEKMFTNATALALKETLEHMCTVETVDAALEKSIATAWMQFMTLGSVQVRQSYITGTWDIDTCECGSGSNVVGPGHSHWCRLHG